MSEPEAHTYQDVVEIVEARIRSGEYPLGSKLPTQDEFADEFELGKTTIAKAIAILRDRSLVVSRPPKGTFVAGSLPE
jgi:GntR family transcriptional regulator